MLRNILWLNSLVVTNQLGPQWCSNGSPWSLVLFINEIPFSQSFITCWTNRLCSGLLCKRCREVHSRCLAQLPGSVSSPSFPGQVPCLRILVQVGLKKRTPSANAAPKKPSLQPLTLTVQSEWSEHWNFQEGRAPMRSRTQGDSNGVEIWALLCRVLLKHESREVRVLAIEDRPTPPTCKCECTHSALSILPLDFGSGSPLQME